MKTVIQCDFDGTITRKDVSFLLLDAFARANWREVLAEYKAGKIPVGAFNTTAFAMVKADRQTLLDFVRRSDVEIRPGFKELLDYCSQKGFRFVIVSNGLDFYIQEILKNLGISGLEVYAARTQFGNDGLAVRYIGPDDRQMQGGFKDTYARLFLQEGYRVVYIGNGVSDFSAAKQAHHVFATDDLRAFCQEKSLHCHPFNGLDEVLQDLKRLPADCPL